MTAKPKPRTPEQRAAIDTARQYLTASKEMGAPQAVLSYAAAQLRAALISKAAPAKAPQAAPPAPPPPAPAPAPIDAGKVGEIRFTAVAPSAFEVAKAHSTLAEAEQAERAASKLILVDQLKTIRVELHALRPKLAALKINLLDMQGNADNVDRAIAVREERVSELMAARPAAADYLTAAEDADVAQWESAIQQKRGELAQLRAHIARLPNLYQERLAGVELSMRINNLQFAETSIINRLSGQSGKAWGGHLITGGVFTAF